MLQTKPVLLRELHVPVPEKPTVVFKLSMVACKRPRSIGGISPLWLLTEPNKAEFDSSRPIRYHFVIAVCRLKEAQSHRQRSKN